MSRLHVVVLVVLAAIIPTLFFAAEDDSKPEGEPGPRTTFLPVPPQWEVVEGPTRYVPDNLYDLIDGEAEAFVGYGFVEGLAAILESADGGSSLEWRLYNMGSKLNAFGIYQLYAPADAQKLDVGAAGLVKDLYAAFYAGEYFVQVQGLSGGEGEAKAGIRLAKETADLLPKDTKPPDEVYLFPKKFLVEGSIRYMPQGAFGYQFLKDSMEARYLLKRADDPAKAMILQRKKPEEAKKAFSAYESFLKEKGKAEIEEAFLGEKALRTVDPYHGNLVLIQAARWVVGVAGQGEWDDLESLAREILKAAAGKRAKPTDKQPESLSKPLP